MANKDLRSIHRRSKSLTVAALFATTLAFGGAIAAATVTARSTTAAGTDEPARLRSGASAGWTYQIQPAISDEDDCAVTSPSFRCTR